MTVNELAAILGGNVEGAGERDITGISSIESISDGSVIFLEKQKFAPMLAGSRPAAVLCSRAATLEGFTLIRVANPRLAFAATLNIFHPARKPSPGMHSTAVVEDGAEVSDSATIGANCYIGTGTTIGAGTSIAPGCCITQGATVGDNCTLYPNVTVLDGCKIGNNVILHSGVVIGADGFGYEDDGDARVKVPQVGIVIIEDDVEIGANCAVDRAAIGVTRVGKGTKIDNMVQIGHNVQIGANCIICGQTGIAGSSKIGNHVTLAGQVGVGDHLAIGDGAIITGRAGVASDIPGGVIYSGFPAAPHREMLRVFAAMKRLPEVVRYVERLMKKDIDPEAGS